MNPTILSTAPSDLRNQLILASPMLHGSLFEKSCILITNQSTEGHEGYIINNQTDRQVSYILKKLTGTELGNLPLHLGGPVRQDSINFLSISTSASGVLTVRHGLQMEKAAAMLDLEGTKVIACLGYSKWVPQQLEDEFEHLTWFHRTPPPNLPSLNFQISLWGRLLKEISPYHHLMSLVPENLLKN